MSQPTTLQKARQLYKDADAAGKILLQQLYPKVKLQVKEKPINTFPAILKAFLKLKVTDPYYKQLQKRKLTDLSAIDRLCIRAHVKRNGWVPDYKSDTQKKWFPIFYYKDDVSGFVFSRTFYGNRYSGTAGGARLASQTRELAEQLAKEAPQDWNEFLTIK